MGEPKFYGYHVTDIPRVKHGEFSKIEEEIAEWSDSRKQGVSIMELCEAADVYLAMKSYIIREFPGFSMEDVRKMAEVTERAFDNGFRKSN